MIGPNTLIYGDNLDVLRRHIADEFLHYYATIY